MRIVGAGRQTLALSAGLSVVAMLFACGSSPATPSGPIAVGELVNVTGKYPAIGKDWLDGATAGIKDVNTHGGVLGRQLVAHLGDSSGDAVDAVPALRQVELSNPAFIVGPSGLEFDGVKSIIDTGSAPDFAFLGGSNYDNLNDPLVYRTVPSDSVIALAMAYYAIKNGWTKCTFLFENTATAQALAIPVRDAYTAKGGTVVANIQLVPHSTSYKSELTQAFANSPQCVFAQTDPQTSGTLFSNMRQLGYASTPVVGSQGYLDISNAKAIGLDVASQYVTTFQSSQGSTPALDYFTQNFPGTPTIYAEADWDAVILAALAMTAAGTSDPKVWASKITAVSNPGGQICSTYAACIAFLQKGTKITYSGASGWGAFDSHHNVFAALQAVRWNSAGTQLQVVADIPGSALAG